MACGFALLHQLLLPSLLLETQILHLGLHGVLVPIRVGPLDMGVLVLEHLYFLDFFFNVSVEASLCIFQLIL
jgi:hypothetical protein